MSNSPLFHRSKVTKEELLTMLGTDQNKCKVS